MVQVDGAVGDGEAGLPWEGAQDEDRADQVALGLPGRGAPEDDGAGEPRGAEVPRALLF